MKSKIIIYGVLLSLALSLSPFIIILRQSNIERLSSYVGAKQAEREPLKYSMMLPLIYFNLDYDYLLSNDLFTDDKISQEEAYDLVYVMDFNKPDLYKDVYENVLLYITQRINIMKIMDQKSGFSLLHSAVFSGNLNKVRLLIKYGADPKHKSSGVVYSVFKKSYDSYELLDRILEVQEERGINSDRQKEVQSFLSGLE